MQCSKVYYNALNFRLLQSSAVQYDMQAVKAVLCCNWPSCNIFIHPLMAPNTGNDAMQCTSVQ